MPVPREDSFADARGRVFTVSSVVTAFAPTRELIENLAALVAQVDHVVVVDDGSGPQADVIFAEAEALGVRVVRLDENAGIAAALNAGLDAALDTDVDTDAILFLDQDSRVGSGYVDALVAAHLAASRAGIPVAGAAPQFFASVSQSRRHRDGSLRARQPIQSGLLVSTLALRAVGPFRDDLFIDLVDTEYSLRAESHGFVFVAAAGVDLPHSLGRQVGLSAFGRLLRAPSGQLVGFAVSAPFRYYYRARNRVAVNRAYRARRPFTIARATLLELRHYVIVWLAVRDRRMFATLLRTGCRDGRRGRMGRIPDAVATAAETITWRVPL